MTDIDTNPIAFIDSVRALMIKHGEIKPYFELRTEEKGYHANNLLKWYNWDPMTKEQLDQAVISVKSFITGVYLGARR